MHPLMQRQMIIWTFVLVIALGAIAGSLMLKPPTAAQELAQSPTFLREQKRRMAKERRRPISLPASETTVRVPASSTPPILFGDHAGHTLDLQIDCRNSNQVRIKKDTAQVRLQGSVCTSNDEIVSSEIRNEDNGFSATVFMTDARSFTTDYISLKRGDNRIRILHLLKSGGREEHELLAHRE